LKLPVGVEVLAIYPHAHYLGKRIEAWATLPDGSRQWLIKISDWDLNWQAVYRYRKPVWLPQGTDIDIHLTYDNSAANPRNPNQPPKRVRTGPRSEDEMGHVWLQVLPHQESNEDPRIVLQEALMRRRKEKYPSDFIAHCNLGAILTMRGKFRDAIPNFELALRIEPASATARNGLGAGLLADGRPDEAIREFREALRIDPLHLNARLNLARAFGQKKDWNDAAAELESLLKQRPDNTEARVGLGAAYSMLGRFDEALPVIQEAVRLKPEDAEIRMQLGALLANKHDLQGAILAFEAALKLNPNHDVARTYLKQAREALARQR
jgi:Flp pilus assembly protein TadD